METNHKSRTHPLILVAAISVTAVALAGVGVLTGILPNPAASPNKPVALADQTPIVLSENKHESKQFDELMTGSENNSGLSQPTQALTSKQPETTSPHPSAKKQASVKKTTATRHKTQHAISPAPTSAVNAPAKCKDCGTVEQIRELTVEPKGSGVGGVAGGVVGGLLGNQVGKGDGRTAATVIGVVGGALAGNKIEKTMKKKQTYETVVRYDDGTTQIFPSDAPPGWREGDKIRVDNGVIVSR